MTKISNSGSSVIINGDFNSHSILWGAQNTDLRGDFLVNSTDSQNLILLDCNRPTYFGPSCQSTLDLTFASPRVAPLCTWDTFNDTLQSDHCPTITDIAFGHDDDASFIPPVFPKEVDPESFLRKFESKIQPYNHDISVVENYNKLHSSLVASASFIPKNKNKIIRTPAPWWNIDCSRAVAKRRLALGELKRNCSRTNFEFWKKTCEDTKKILEENKKMGWRNYCSSLNPSTKIGDVWKIIKRFKGSRAQSSISVTPFHERVMEEFGHSLAGPMGPVNGFLCSSPYQGYIASPLNVKFFDTPFTMDELKCTLETLKNTSPGIDGIRNSVLKLIPTSGLDVLLKVFNQFYVEGLIPDSWRDFEIVALPKPGRPLDQVSSLRPIAKVSCLRKLFEKLLKARLDYFMESNSLLPDSQYGFRKGRSTTDSITLLWSNLSYNINQNLISITAFIDITGAFNNVNIDILLSHMASLNFSPQFVKIIYELFKYKNLFFNTFSNNKFNLRSFLGLPQGSCLSPSLYELYCNEIDRNISGCLCLQFADDISLTCVGETIGEARENLQSVVNQLATNLSRLNLTISLDKTKCVIFSKNRHSLHSPPSIFINNKRIDYVDSFCFLGYTFHYNLSNKEHIKVIAAKGKKLTDIMKALAGVWWGGNPHTLLTVYKGLVRPVLEYSSSIYNDSALCDLIKIDRVQYAALRIALGAFRSTHVKSLEVEANIMPLKDRRRVTIDKLCLKSLTFNKKDLISSILKLDVLPQVPLLTSRLVSLKDLNIYRFERFLDLYPDYRLNFVRPKCFSLIGSKSEDLSQVNHKFDKLIESRFSDFSLAYSDGSKDASRVGCAFLIPDFGIEASFSLNPSSSIFTAEATAILEILKMILILNVPKILIITDSKSVLSSLSNTKNSAPVILEIKDLLIKLYDINIQCSFLWVPSHSGIKGNEEVDVLARTSLNSSSITHPKMYHNDYFPTSLNLSVGAWQDDWNMSPFGRRFYSLKNNVNVAPWFVNHSFERSEITSITRLRFGHNTSKQHLFRINIIDSDICDCELATQDIDHYLFECPLTDSSLRIPFMSKIRNHFNIQDVCILNILKNGHHLVYKELADYLKKSGLKL